MKNAVQNFTKTILVAGVVLLLAGCSLTGRPGQQGVLTPGAAWLTYWDLPGGERELRQAGAKLTQLSYFGAYFDQSDRLFIPAGLSTAKSEHDKLRPSYESYLTFINDRQKTDGTVELKDTGVLRRLLGDDAALDNHIAEIIGLALQGGYDGVEIDYERIWREKDIGPLFMRFAERLYAQTRANGLKLRIVLEPGTPFADTGFFPGPEYVVMLYNLHGLHSGPGPKASPKFIETTISKMQALPGDKAVAFSTGGCEWGDNGQKRFLTEAQARELALQHDSRSSRDPESRCLIFKYQAEGVDYVVWYADLETLNHWIDLANKQGIAKVSLWRLGGNVTLP